MTQKVVKTDCIMCINSCGINAYVEDGKLAATSDEEGKWGMGKDYLG